MLNKRNAAANVNEPLTGDKESPLPEARRQIAFICGVGRSGTSALATLLNSHPLVCIGLERFKFLFLKMREFPQDAFERERFFDFRPEDTNILPSANKRWERLYRTLSDKWEKARLTGDKVPHLFDVMPDVQKRFPHTKIVYMLRDIHKVASSWNARALNPQDTWPEDQDFRESVLVWNRANHVIAEQVRRCPEQFCIVLYEKFFSGERSQLGRLCRFLDIAQDPNLKVRYRQTCQLYLTKISTKPSVILEGQNEFISAHADMALYEFLVKDAGLHLA